MVFIVIKVLKRKKKLKLPQGPNQLEKRIILQYSVLLMNDIATRLQEEDFNIKSIECPLLLSLHYWRRSRKFEINPWTIPCGTTPISK